MIYTPQAPGRLLADAAQSRPRPPQREGPRRHEWRREQPSLGQERVEPRREVAGVHAGERLHGAGAVDHKVGAEVPLDLARGLIFEIEEDRVGVRPIYLDLLHEVHAGPVEAAAPRARQDLLRGPRLLLQK